MRLYELTEAKPNVYDQCVTWRKMPMVSSDGTRKLLKKIVRRKVYRSPDAFGKKGGTVQLFLVCGHVTWKKLSRNPKHRAKCPECRES